MKPVNIKHTPQSAPEDTKTQRVLRSLSENIKKERIMRLQDIAESSVYIKLPKRLSIEMNVFPNCCLIIGRAPEPPENTPFFTTLALDCSEISRTHLALFMENESLFIQDMNSSNGSFITTNGVRTALEPETPMLLNKDAVVEFGEAVLNIKPAPLGA